MKHIKPPIQPTYPTYEAVAKSNKKRWSKVDKKQRSETMKKVRRGEKFEINN